MKKIKIISGLLSALVLVVLCSVALSASSFRVGMGADEDLTRGGVKEAFEDAAGRFSDWAYSGTPDGYVTRQGTYFVQTFDDGQGRKAAVYVNSDREAFVLRGVLLDQYAKNAETWGMPASDTFEVNGVWYQNFTNGSVKAEGESGETVFTAGNRVDRTGSDVPLPTTASDGDYSGKTDGTPASSAANQIKSDVTQMAEDAKKTTEVPRWVAWIVLAGLVGCGIALAAFVSRRPR